MLSFSLPSRSSSHPNPSTIFDDEDDDGNANRNDGKSVQYVNEFDSSKALGSDPEPRVIPPIPNEWLKKPESETPSEVASLSAYISSGLNLRQRPNFGNPDGDGVDLETLALQRLKYDLKRLPEDRGVEEYNDMSMEEFGAALLGGYGWCPGKGIGKNKESDVRGVEYRRRVFDRQGLGFQREQ